MMDSSRTRRSITLVLSLLTCSNVHAVATVAGLLYGQLKVML